jgi:hypothetical protein
MGRGKGSIRDVEIHQGDYGLRARTDRYRRSEQQEAAWIKGYGVLHVISLSLRRFSPVPKKSSRV